MSKDQKKQAPERATDRRPKSVHGGESTTGQYVRIRHPEGRRHLSEMPEPTLLEIPGSMEPEEALLSLDQPCEPFADTTCYLLDHFGRTAAGGTWSASADGGSWSSGSAYQALVKDDSDFQFYPALTHYVWSSLGSASYSWVSASNTECTGLDFQFDGWMEQEAWWSFTVPTHPTDLAGVNLGPLTFLAPTGLAGGTVGQLEGANLVVRSEAPDGMRQGTYVAHLPHNVATSVFIPGSLIPDAGDTLYVGVVPNWYAEYGDVTCGFRWPWMDGQGHSAKGYIQTFTQSFTWQSFDTGAGEWGSIASDDTTGAWWEGNLPLTVQASGGTWGLDGEHLYLTVSSGGQETLTATYPGVLEALLADDNDDAVGEPWSLETGVSMKARFKVTTAGAVGDSGSRFLRFRWHDGRDLVTGEVRIGDGLFAEGLLVYDSDGWSEDNNYVAKAITEGSYMWVLLDARNPFNLKMKMWEETEVYGKGEPAKWDIIITRELDTESPTRRDYFQIDMSAGNASGADQTIQVDSVFFCGSGSDCEWVQEHMGQGDAETFAFNTSQPYKSHSLWWFVDGMHVLAVEGDRAQGAFKAPLSLPAGQDVNLVARYRVDLNPDGD